MTSMIGTLVLNLMEMVWPRESEPCPQPRAVEHLLWRVARGDREALAALYDQTGALAYGLAMRITGDRAAAEEISVAVYQLAWEDARTLADSTCFLSWLAESTRTLALERRQPVPWRDSQPHLASPAKTNDPSVSTEKGQSTAPLPREWEARRRRARAALARLAPEERAAVELAYFSGLTAGDIARHMELPEESVKALLRSGMITFRCALSQGLSSDR